MEIGLLGYISENLQRMQKYGFKPVGFVDIKNRFVFKVEKEGKLYAAKFASPFQRPNLFRQLWHDNALSQTDGSVENPLFNKKGEVS